MIILRINFKYNIFCVLSVALLSKFNFHLNILTFSHLMKTFIMQIVMVKLLVLMGE